MKLMKNLFHNERRLPRGFILLTTVPTVVLSVVFILYPAVSGVYYSLTDAATVRSQVRPNFIGLENYIYLFTRDRLFGKVVLNTLKLLLIVPPCTVFISLVMAVLFSQSKLKEKGIYRTLLFLPSVISLSVDAIVWACIFDPRPTGIANQFLAFFGVEPVTWLGDARFAIFCVAVVLVWQAAGYYMVMIIAGLDSIPNTIYEAASLDGASAAARLFRITVPLMKDIIGIVFIFSVSGTLNLSFIITKVMTGGGPGNSTLVLGLYTYNMAFGINTNLGYSMVLAVFSMVLGILVSLGSRKISYNNENQ
jgi:N-acetylglucosamine transport system permease protein